MPPTRSSHVEFSTPLVPVLGDELDGNVTLRHCATATKLLRRVAAWLLFGSEKGDILHPAALSNGKDLTISAHQSKAIRTTRNILMFKRTPQTHELLRLMLQEFHFWTEKSACSAKHERVESNKAP
jgi:hypothetical protein